MSRAPSLEILGIYRAFEVDEWEKVMKKESRNSIAPIMHDAVE